MCNMIPFLTGKILKKITAVIYIMRQIFILSKIFQQALKKSGFSHSCDDPKSNIEQVMMENFLQFSFPAVVFCGQKITFLYRST